MWFSDTMWCGLFSNAEKHDSVRVISTVKLRSWDIWFRAVYLFTKVKSRPYFYHELKLKLKEVGPLVTRGGLERSYFCVTDQSMAALVWLRAAMLSSVPCVEAHLHASHSIFLLPVLYLRRSTEQAFQSMTGRGNLSLTSRVSSFSLKPKSLILKYLSQFWWSSTKEIYKSLKPVSVHYRNKAWKKNIGVHSF